MQEQAPNRPVLLRSKGVVVSDRGKVVRKGRQVRVEKMSESKPFDDASLRDQSAVETGGNRLLQDQSGRDLFTGLTAAGVEAA